MSKVSFKNLSKVSLIKSSRRLLTRNTTTGTSTSNFSLEPYESSSRRLLHISAKPVTVKPNYDRPVFHKSKSEAISIETVLDKLFVFTSLDRKDREHVFDAFEKVYVPKK